MDSALRVRYLQIYRPKGMNSFWFSDLTRAGEKIQWLNDVISKSMEHGINPEHFGMKKVLDFTSKLNFQKPDYRKLAKTELLLTDAYYTYCSGMQYGFFDPVKLYPKDYFIHMQQPDSAFIRFIFANSDSLKVYLDKVQPKLPEYKTLQSEMQRLLTLKDSVLPEIPFLKPKTTIKVGNMHPSVPLVARRLMITGELAYTYDVDSVYRVFNDTLLTALNKFRRKYNLLTDKEIGNKTIEALNRDFESQYWVVIANLERLRWKPSKDISNKYVHVNVANMTLQALRGDTIIRTMKVVVGKPPKHKTPLLYGKMYEVVLNPTWTVPNSIIINEISRLMMTDTSYLSRNNMKIYKNRVPVNKWNIPWGSLSNTYQPYVIVQDAGPGNSLGKLKFNFSNPFNVYLHDTNSKSAFDLHYRGLSHGCVRVEKPLELAFFCLHDIDSADKNQVKENNILKDRIRYSIGLIPETEEGKKALEDGADKQKLKRVELKPGVTVLLDYRTCFAGKNGEVQFCNDYYNMDSLLVTKLKNIH
ncbi:MAG: L,D-transpeptidase family protein [Paludibacteraceae bacterium]